ncbi:hypothetical protein EPIR_3253 [Erwinia piriflorinigrans CFBP 5888]|uniref:Uncharacterized protein n=1 Tax=Erwinia piriflorinigrans CFBP 5888 TaxID=1161919 RepID=V5ZCG2_9GAMM|nr:hypothetical protein EPIR_3253 [Erwinia piriflorinigrans CFBP 5888]
MMKIYVMVAGKCDVARGISHQIVLTFSFISLT